MSVELMVSLVTGHPVLGARANFPGQPGYRGTVARFEWRDDRAMGWAEPAADQDQPGDRRVRVVRVRVHISARRPDAVPTLPPGPRRGVLRARWHHRVRPWRADDPRGAGHDG